MHAYPRREVPDSPPMKKTTPSYTVPKKVLRWVGSLQPWEHWFAGKEWSVLWSPARQELPLVDLPVR